MSDLTTVLLSAGACFEGNTFLKCALNPSECTSRLQYRSSRWLASNDPYNRCHSSDSVSGLFAMGRCNSNTDRFMCTSDASACQLSLGWVPFDAECTVSDDSREQSEWAHSYFGECNGNGNNFCAWKSSDCPDDDGYNFMWACFVARHQEPDCRCDDVKTGACVSDNDPDFFFCAATEEVCFADDAGMSYKKPLEVEAELGITCKLCDDDGQPQPEPTPVQEDDNGFVCDICPGGSIVNPNNMVGFFGYESTCIGVASYIANNAPALGYTAEAACALILPEVPRYSCCGENTPPDAELTTALVEAGACYHETTNEFIKCALTPLECFASLYRSAKWLARRDPERRCDSQESIHGLNALGRCDSNTDKYICTSDASACQLSAGWDPFDGDCTVIDDLRQQEFEHSYFGECLSASGQGDFCAWKSSDCPDAGYRFQWANPFFAGAIPDCRCDDVKTGACVSDEDPNDFFCATTAEVCASEVGMSYRKPLDAEAELGITCKLCDELRPPPEVMLVTAGACVVDGGFFTKCALVPEHCGAADETFLSTAAISDPNVDTPRAANECLTQNGVQNVNLGRCVAQSNMFLCVPTPEACNMQKFFAPNDPDCTVADDKSPTRTQSTHYGFCSPSDDLYGVFDPETSFCVWDSWGCYSSSSSLSMNYYDANLGISGSQPQCRCDDVRTGACIHKEDPSRRHCAVQYDACDNTDDWTFVDLRDLESPTGENLICKLCTGLPPLTTSTSSVQQQQPAASSPPPPTPTGRPTFRPTNPPIDRTAPPPTPPTSSSSSLSSSTSSMSQLSPGAIGGIVSAIVGVSVMVVIVVYRSAPSRNRLQRETEMSAPEAVMEPGLTDRDLGRTVMEPGQTEEDFVPQEDRSVT